MYCNKPSFQNHFDRDLENNTQILEHNADRLEETPNRIMHLVMYLSPNEDLD